MRVTLSDDHNHTTECFKRTMAEDHLLETDHEIFTTNTKNECIAWLVGAVIALGCAIAITISLQDTQASIQDAGITKTVVTAKVQTSANKACPTNSTAAWLDSYTMICLSEQP